MPRFRPGEVKYAINTSGLTIKHGTPCKVGTVVGIAIKQKAPLPTDALSTNQDIVANEQFLIKHKHVAEVPAVGGATDDALVYIDAANALTLTATANTVFGRVYDLPGTRGLPSTRMRVDMDRKV